ncbi:MAG: GGDEF domain-containing protein [Colwellia sp.]|jgi:GGDEF domain-containing protein
MLPDTSKTDTLLFCQKSLRLITKITVDNSPLTISIGVTTADEKISFTGLYFQADNAVNKANEFGRNRTEVYVA